MINIKYCPLCGKELYTINNLKSKYYICKDSTCRAIIKEDKITVAEIDKYLDIKERLNIEESRNNSNAYMLLKENLSGPMLIRINNNNINSIKCMYCIIYANSHDEAYEIFKKRFDFIKVTHDMIVNIDITEIQ